MPAEAILHSVSLLILHLEFVIKDLFFYLIGFPFFVNYRIFTYAFDFVCHVDVHESLKAQQAAATVTLLKVYA